MARQPFVVGGPDLAQRRSSVLEWFGLHLLRQHCDILGRCSWFIYKAKAEDKLAGLSRNRRPHRFRG